MTTLLFPAFLLSWASVSAFTGAAPPPRPAMEFLAVQKAKACTFKTVGSKVHLTFEGLSNTTTLFSDRPFRKDSRVATTSFFGAFGETFGSDLPNAAIIMDKNGAEEGPVVASLQAANVDGRPAYALAQSSAQQAAGPMLASIEGSTFELCVVFIDGAAKEQRNCSKILNKCANNNEYTDDIKTCADDSTCDKLESGDACSNSDYICASKTCAQFKINEAKTCCPRTSYIEINGESGTKFCNWIPDGGDCSDDTQCTSSPGWCKNNKCHASRTAGDVCDSNDQCPNGYCGRYKVDGDTRCCPRNSWAHNYGGLNDYCNWVPDGQECSDDVICANQNCVENVCKPK